MYGWLVRLMLRRAIRRANAGDIGPVLSAYADDATLVFPGQSSWSGEHRGKDEIERFLQRFARAGIQLEAHEISVSGPPWNMTVFLRFTDRATAADGSAVYENRGVIHAKIVWGKITYQEDFEDTEKVAEFDRYLAAQDPGRTAVGTARGDRGD